MKNVTLVIGLICILLFAFSTKAGRAGDFAQLPSTSLKTVVAREWKGRIAAARDAEYYPYLLEGVKRIRTVPGSLGVQVMKRNEAGAVEYTVISYWESREAIKAFAGQDIEKPHHLARDREFLLELPTRVLHYDVIHTDLAQVRLSE